MTEDRDEVIDRIAAALQPLPAVDPAARARVLVAVAAEREREREHARASRGYRRRWIFAAAVAATLLMGIAIEWRTRAALPANTHVAAARGTDAPSSAASAALASRPLRGDAAMQPVQFVFRAPAAHRVSVVGDFTGWESRPGVMVRDAASGLWSTTLALPAGRHVYAFLIDDTLWVRDPRTPAAPDADFGRPGSVLLVGRP